MSLDCDGLHQPKSRSDRFFPSIHSLRVLANAFYGMPLDAGRRDRRGHYHVVGTCVQRGALDGDHQLTEAGLRVLAAHTCGGNEHATNP